MTLTKERLEQKANVGNLAHKGSIADNERWGVIRHGSSGGVASFDGWYGGKRPAMDALEHWCGAHARWSLSLIEECEVDHPRELAALPRMGEGRDDSRVC